MAWRGKASGGPGGVGGRGRGPKEEKRRFLKDDLWGWGGEYVGLAVGGGSKGFGSGGGSGRGPKDGANFAMSFLTPNAYKKEK